MSHIETTAAPAARDAAVDIRCALGRALRGGCERVEVSVDGACVLLTGRVRTPAERRAAIVAAWDASGLSHVIDDIVVIGT